MLTRRHIRIKVMQSVYAFSHTEKGKVEEQILFFEKSLFDGLELLLLQWSLFQALKQLLEEQKISVQKKYLQQSEQLNPYDALLNNVYFKFIAEHPLLTEKVKQYKMKDWDLEFKLIRNLWEDIQQNPAFQSYCQVSNPKEAKQLEVLVSIFEHTMAPAEYLHIYYEDRALTWQDDLPMVNTHVLKTLKKIDLTNRQSLSFPDRSQWKEELSFGKALLEKVLTQETTLTKELEGKTPNWEADRIALVDALILKIAIAELLYFPAIPPKVTLNEFLEIAKEYSTPKSNTFINGVLDKLVKEFTDQNRMNKSGRGLL